MLHKPWIVLILIILAAIQPLGAFAEDSWNLRDEFTVKGDGSVWRYGQSDTKGGAFIPFSSHETNRYGMDILNMGTSMQPSLLYNGAGRAMTDQGNRLTWPAGCVSMHPSNDGKYCVVRWTAPRSLSGRPIHIIGSFTGADADRATTDVAIIRNGSALWSSYVNLHGNPTSVAFDINVTAAQPGDVVDFVVGYGNGDYYDDSTLLDAAIMSGLTPEARDGYGYERYGYYVLGQERYITMTWGEISIDAERPEMSAPESGTEEKADVFDVATKFVERPDASITLAILPSSAPACRQIVSGTVACDWATIPVRQLPEGAVPATFSDVFVGSSQPQRVEAVSTYVVHYPIREVEVVRPRMTLSAKDGNREVSLSVNAEDSATELGKICRYIIPANLPQDGHGFLGEGTELHNCTRLFLCTLGDLLGAVGEALATTQELQSERASAMRHVAWIQGTQAVGYRGR